MPIVGGPEDPEILQLRGGKDDALYLKYQEYLAREIAVAFGLSPQNLGVEADVNRNTAEVAEDRDWDHAIKPWAHLYQSHINRQAIHKRLGFSQVMFRFVGWDREDEKATAEIYELRYQNNSITPNEQRKKLGEQPLASPVGKLTRAEAMAPCGSRQLSTRGPNK